MPRSHARRAILTNRTREPGSHSRLREKAATDEELTELVRAMQVELLYSFCYPLENPGVVEDGVSNVAWALVQIDNEGSILETDPTGREVCPRPVD